MVYSSKLFFLLNCLSASVMHKSSDITVINTSGSNYWIYCFAYNITWTSSWGNCQLFNISENYGPYPFHRPVWQHSTVFLLETYLFLNTDWLLPFGQIHCFPKSLLEKNQGLSKKIQVYTYVCTQIYTPI